MAYHWSCFYCDHLDRSRIKWDDRNYCFNYGCNKRGANGFTCIWGRNDKEFKTGGCSDFRETQPLEQLSLFAM